MRPFALALILALAAGPAFAQPASSWAAHQGPSAGPARVIGTTSLGCLAGGEALPTEGPGWQAVRLSRNRNWGHPETIRSIRTLARRARSVGLPDLLIGDVAQPRGGPLPYGHASHQSGLDFDVWLDVNPRAPLSRAQREDWPVASLVVPDQSGVDPNRFTAAHARLIRLAAELPNVDRVLVNHGIKRSLCAVHGGETWLRRVRPWRGHDSHMHVRMRCPAGSAECQEAPPIPAGDGCDASLDWWLSDEARRPPSPPRTPGPPPALPAACGPVFRAR
ncbi:penicillin-insensitive murein endopeptidase [Sabulicella rubraurantiaca]|uniref:penicillin-insensitive murein endopeptidase n=1 Tax=Sabulicella rubraurantiaca TaxID=2811429 RepID=UPI001A973C02|nr:penicillin-insensitive murein endopeptidase [Sabulicella rubraurantiaca]